MSEELSESQSALLRALGELKPGDHWLCFVNAGFSVEDAEVLWRRDLIDATKQMGMPCARLRQPDMDSITIERGELRRLIMMAKNDAMMMEAMSRHQPVPGTETPEFGAQADDDMAFVNKMANLCGMEPIFAVPTP